MSFKSQCQMTNKVAHNTCQLASQLTPNVHILLRIETENVLTIFYHINRTQQEMKLVEKRKKNDCTKLLLFKLSAQIQTPIRLLLSSTNISYTKFMRKETEIAKNHCLL